MFLVIQAADTSEDDPDDSFEDILGHLKSSNVVSGSSVRSSAMRM